MAGAIDLDQLTAFGTAMSAKAYRHAMNLFKGDANDTMLVIAHQKCVFDGLTASKLTTYWGDADPKDPVVNNVRFAAQYLDIYEDDVPAIGAFLDAATVQDFYALWRVVTSPEPDFDNSVICSKLVRDVAHAAGIDCERSGSLATQLAAKDIKITSLTDVLDDTSSLLNSAKQDADAHKALVAKLTATIESQKQEALLQARAIDRLETDKEQLIADHEKAAVREDERYCELTATHDALSAKFDSMVIRLTDVQTVQKSMREIAALFKNQSAVVADEPTKKRNRSDETETEPSLSGTQVSTD